MDRQADPSGAQHVPPLRILILSHLRLLREGLAASLAHRHDIEVVENLAPSAVALTRIADSGAAALLLDIAMPCALEIPKAIRCRAPGIKVIAMAVNEADHDLLQCAEAGVCGYVTQDSSVSDLVTTVHSAVRGEVMCSPRIAAMLFQRVASLSESSREAPRTALLSRREREIVELLEENLSNKAIARRLRISAATVKNHVHNILEKLQVRCRSDAVTWLRGEAAPHANRNVFRRRMTDAIPKRAVDA